MATKNISIMRPVSYWGLIFSLAIVVSFVVFGPLTAEAGVLFESSWNTAVGASNAAIFDGGVWFGGSGNAGTQQTPYVSAGGPGGNNYLNMVTVGGGGWGNPYYFNWEISAGDTFKDPDNLFVRFYFRVDNSWGPNGPTKHWFAGVNNPSDQDTKHYISFNGRTPDLPKPTPFALEVQEYSTNGRFQSALVMEKDRWYCYEIHIQRVDSNKERWYIRLDGVDITDTYYCLDGSMYGEWLDEWYAAGNGWVNSYHGSLWLSTYDMIEVNDGWDVAAIEIRDDRWPGLIDGGGPPPTDTTPPTGSIETTGVENRADKTGSTAVTLSLSATDTGSGMGTGAQMQFSNDGATWSSPEPYAQSKAWTLLDTAPGTEQSRTIHVKFKDVAGNWSNAISDTIILDRQPPSAPLW